MPKLTDNQTNVLTALVRLDRPMFATALAEASCRPRLAAPAARTALKALVRRGLVEATQGARGPLYAATQDGRDHLAALEAEQTGTE